MTNNHSLRSRSRFGLIATLILASGQVVSCISSSSGGGGRGDAGASAAHAGVKCPLACSNQASTCADASSLPSTQTCLSSCTTEAAKADIKSCGNQWDDFVACCAEAQGATNCGAANLPRLEAVNGCSTSCRALLGDYSRCSAQGSATGDASAAAGGSGPGPMADASTSSPDAGAAIPGTVQVQGFVHNTVGGVGAPVAGADIKVGGVTLGTTDSSGLFNIMADTTALGVLLQLEAAEHAPQVVRVPVKPGVTTYNVPVVMQRIQSISVPMGSTSAFISIDDGLTMSTVDFDQPIAEDSTLTFAPFAPENGPGELKAKDAPAGEGLQSGGMMWFEMKDSAGNPIPMPGASMKLDIPADQITGAGDWKGYAMDPETGLWSDPVAPTAMAGTVLTFPLTATGYWNADRGFPRACVKGTVSAASAAACGGARVQASGSGISSFDSIGEGGDFCVSGAQSMSSNLEIGAYSQTVFMPSNAGDCSAPETCADIGEVVISADDCDLMSLVPPPAEAGNPCTAVEQCTPGNDCFGGFCVGAGVLRISLSFTVNSDFDLHLTTPSLSEIYFGSRSADGGTLDVDQCIGSNCDASEHVENIVFTTAPAGLYDVWVVNYNGTNAGSFTIDVSGAATQTFTGTLPAVGSAESMHFPFQIDTTVVGGGGQGGASGAGGAAGDFAGAGGAFQ